MTTPDVREPILRSDVAPSSKGGVWEVRNFHTTLEKRAVAGATMSGGYFAMTAVATVMATAGLLLDSAAAVIGAMCVAPFMGPSRAVCIGALFRNRQVFLAGFFKQLIGLLIIGVSLAAVMTVVLDHTVSGIGITSEILIRAMPTTRDVVLSALVALAAGAAASLALVAQPSVVETPWGQVMDAIIGVEIAISLAPPAAVIGIGLALGTPEHSLNALCLLLLNVLSLDLVGSTAILALGGVRLKHLELEKRIRDTVSVTLDVVPGFTAADSTVHVTLFGIRDVKVEVILRRRFGGQVPETLAATIASDLERTTGCHSDVTVQIIPLLTHYGRTA